MENTNKPDNRSKILEDAIDQSSNGSLSNPLDLMEYEIEMNPCAKVSCNKQHGFRM